MFGSIEQLAGAILKLRSVGLAASGVSLRTLELTEFLTTLGFFSACVAIYKLLGVYRDKLFRRLGILAIFFFLSCGTSRVTAVLQIGHPQFEKLNLAVVVVRGLLSLAMAFALLRLLPTIERLPSRSQLEAEIEERKKAEANARGALERLSTVLDNVHEYAIYTIDSAGVVLTWDIGAQRLKGYTAEEIVGKHFSCFYSAEDLARRVPEEALRTAAETGRYEAQGWRIRKDGVRFWADVILRPLRDTAGALIGFTKVTHDLTESREVETKFQALLEAAPDAILIVNRGGNVDFANAQVEKIFGYRRAELLGNSVDLLNPAALRGEQAKLREHLFSQLSRVEVAAEAGVIALRKDGTEFPIEFSLSPLETRDGFVFLIAIRDISERRKSEARFRTLLESAPDAMVIVNSAGLIELTNRQAERIFQYAGTELVGQSVEILVPPSLHAAHSHHRGRFFGSPKQREMGRGIDLMAVRRDGSEFPVEISLSPIEGPNGISVTAAIRDVSERKEAARQLAEKMAELRHSNEELEQFAHVASHDLQEPLRMVASYTQLLAKRYKGRLDPDADEFIAFAIDGTRRMKRLIEDLLIYSRAGKRDIETRTVDSGEALSEALGNLQAAIQESGAQVSRDQLPSVIADRSWLVQVFQNLVGNAIKYRADHAPAIRISARKAETEWIFAVADNGIGIAPEYHDRIFVIFQRLHGRGEYEGTGIGLAICKRILLQQGGRIWVESELGRGSTFFFSLPLR